MSSEEELLLSSEEEELTAGNGHYREQLENEVEDIMMDVFGNLEDQTFSCNGINKSYRPSISTYLDFLVPCAVLKDAKTAICDIKSIKCILIQ